MTSSADEDAILFSFNVYLDPKVESITDNGAGILKLSGKNFNSDE